MAVSDAYVDLPTFRESLAAAGGPGSRTAANLPDHRLEYHLAQAHAEVLGKLRAGYVIAGPADTDPPPPPMLGEIIAAHAGYGATIEWAGGAELSQRDAIVLRYDRAREILGQIVRGFLELPGIVKPGPGEQTGAGGWQPVAYGPGLVGLADDVDLSSTGFYPGPGYSQPRGGW